MENLPYLLLASLIAGVAVLTFGINTLVKIDTMSDEEKVLSELKQLDNKMNILKSTSIGSFDYVYLETKRELVIFSNGTAIYSGKKFEFSNKFSCITADSYECKNKITLPPGRYKILLYHGDKFEARYCLCFT